MTWFDHGRRAASVLLVALCLLAIPAVAEARFTASRPATLSVGTDRLVTPANFAGSYSCSSSRGTEYMTVRITSFTDTGSPNGLSYGFGLALGSTVKDSAYSTTRIQTLDGSRSSDGVATTWTIGIQGYLANWSSAIGTETIVCPSSGTKSGNF